jgi:phosphatidylglycerol lysyltransferase
MPLRAAVEHLRDEWLRSRGMEPMDFLVAVKPFHAAGEHLYFVAERGGEAVQFLSAVPIYARDGWLMEDMLRGNHAPNGTTELLIAALMRRLGGDPYWVTPGLTPLAGTVAPWLRAIRFAATPLYNFSGLWKFRARLHPAAWTPIWLAWDRGLAPLVIADVLRAFAGGRMLSFAVRSLVHHPAGRLPRAIARRAARLARRASRARPSGASVLPGSCRAGSPRSADTLATYRPAPPRAPGR